MNYSKRRQKVTEFLETHDAFAFFVTNAKNIFYLCGFRGISPTERESSLCITKNRSFHFIPAMYAAQAREAVTFAGEDLEVIVDKERDGLLTIFGKYVPKAARVYYETCDLRVSELESIKQKTDVVLFPQQDLIENMRLYKDFEEMEAVRQAIAISEQTFDAILEFLKLHRTEEITELDLADIMKRLSRNYGGEGFGFDPIIASGMGSAIPHHFTGKKVIEWNASLLLDFGIEYKGYTADITRTIFLGEPSDRFRQVYEWVRECQQISAGICAPGVSVGRIGETAVNYFKGKGVADYFLHGLGHGMGLAVHEMPYLRPTHTTVLQPGMIVTIEPGLYFEGDFGVRIEDDILITENGHEILTNNEDRGLVILSSQGVPISAV
jgi:Xaa-Pro aminopeptidase